MPEFSYGHSANLVADRCSVKIKVEIRADRRNRGRSAAAPPSVETLDDSGHVVEHAGSDRVAREPPALLVFVELLDNLVFGSQQHEWRVKEIVYERESGLGETGSELRAAGVRSTDSIVG